MKTYYCPVCRNPLTEQEYERARGILGEHERHLNDKTAECTGKLKDARARATEVGQEGFSAERARNLAFHFLVRALIVKDGRLLLNQFVNLSFTFLPGGHVEPGEGLQAALKRELVEELGIEVSVAGYRGAVEYLWEHDLTGQLHYEVNHVFEVQASIPDHTVASRDPNLQFHWSTQAELDAYDLRPEPIRQLARQWMSGDRSPWWATNLPQG